MIRNLNNKITIFPDTNLFIQCKDLKELNWNEITKANEICIIIPRTVQLEIDYLKQSSNNRRSKRARKTNSLFREIIESETSNYILKESNPYVELTISSLISRKNFKKDILNINKPDDSIINEALYYQKKNRNKTVIFLTHDTNPMQTAKLCKLSFISIPDKWLLPPENDKKDKEILLLKNRVNELENRLPIIEISAEDLFGNNIEIFDITIEKYNKLTNQNINNIIDKFKNKFPMETIFETDHKFENNPVLGPVIGGYSEIIPPSVDEIKKYKDEIYPNWLNKIKNILNKIHSILDEKNYYKTFHLIVQNRGGAPAENMNIKYECSGDVFFNPNFLIELLTMSQFPKFPRPPRPPQSKVIERKGLAFPTIPSSLYDSFKSSLFRTTPIFNPLTNVEHRDRNKFYWEDKPEEKTKLISHSCEEFKHKVDAENFNFNIFIPRDKEIKNGVIKCVITAKNLPDPVKYTLPIKIKYNTKNIYDMISNKLDEKYFNVKKEVSDESLSN